MHNIEFHFRLEFHKSFVSNDMTFRDCACHFRLELSDFGAIFGLERPEAGQIEDLNGDETPPEASGRSDKDGDIGLRNHRDNVPRDTGRRQGKSGARGWDLRATTEFVSFGWWWRFRL